MMNADAALYRSLVTHLPDAVLVADRAGTCLDANGAALTLFGHEREELIGGPLHLVIAPWPPAGDRAWGDSVITRQDGMHVPVHTWALDLPASAEGEGIVAVCLRPVVRVDAGENVARNREDHDAAEIAMVQRQTRQVLERITDGFYALDRDWRFTYVNEAAERMLGRTRDELLGANIWEAFPPTVESPLHGLFHDAMGAGITSSVEFFYPPFDAWFDVRAYPSVDGLSVFFRDVTASKRREQDLRASEEQFRTLIDHLPAVIYLLAADEDQTALYFSPRLEELTGFRPDEALVRPSDWHWSQTIHPDDRARVVAEDARTVAAGEALRIEYRYLRKDGGYVWVRDECVPVRDEVGQIVAWQGILLDISERVQSDEAQLRLAAIVTSSSEAMIGTTPEGVITSWNPAAERLYGYSTAEAIGHPVTMLAPPENPGDVKGLVARVYRGESIKGHETVRLTKDGRRIDVSLSISPVFDVSHNIVAISTVARDITELRRAEAALRLRDQALAATTNGIVITDPTLPDNPIVDVNPAFEALTGYGREELLGQSFRMLYGPETDPAAVLRIREAILAGRDIAETLLTFRKDGTPFWSHNSVSAVRDDAGRLTHFVGVVSDVTETTRQQQDVARLAAIVESSDDAIVGTLLDGTITSWNPAAERLYGYRAAEAVGQSLAMLVAPNDARAASEVLARLARGEHFEQYETRHLTKHDRMLDVVLTMSPVRDSDGTITGISAFSRDVTELRRLHEERNRLHRELEAEFQRAAEIQEKLLPHEAPDIDQYEFAGICRPARQVGGDFYDWFAGQETVRISLGDVMGKGMPASLMTATARTALRVVGDLPVSAAVEAVNRVLSRDLQQFDGFITLFHAALEPERGTLTYVDAGHGMALIQRQDGSVERLRQSGLPLGVLPDAGYPAETTVLGPGDTLVVYSDGLPDSRPDLDLDADAVAGFLDGLPTARAKLDRLVRLVDEAETRPDDLTLLLIRRAVERSPVGAASPTRGVVAGQRRPES